MFLLVLNITHEKRQLVTFQYSFYYSSFIIKPLFLGAHCAQLKDYISQYGHVTVFSYKEKVDLSFLFPPSCLECELYR